MDREMTEINQRVSSPDGGATDHSTNHHDTVIITIADVVVNDNSTSSTDFNSKSIDHKEVVKKKAEEVEEEKSSISIDIIHNSNNNNQRVCRICHLNAKESGNSLLMELMEIGCNCKGELGIAHLHCAEAWFRVKGNRLCEICGETAKNITGVSDNGFMEEWYERRPGDGGNTTSDENRRCLRGQPLCNFLMACLVIAFVLPWFFRVNMF